MKKILIILYVGGLFIMNSCVNNVKDSSSQENLNITTLSENYLIDRNGVGIFKLNESLKDLNIPKCERIVDTSYSDEDGILNGKQYFFDKNNSVIVWIGDGDVIYEVSTNMKNYSTSEGIRVGSSFADVFKKLNKNYRVETDCGKIMLFDKKNHLRIWFTNSNLDLFTHDEINDLDNYKLSISQDKLDRMSVRKIDLFLIEDY